jgi:hypothetical protein
MTMENATAKAMARQAGRGSLTDLERLLDAVIDGDFDQGLTGAVLLSGAQTVAGVKTFSSPPVMSGASISAGTVPGAAVATGTLPLAALDAGAGLAAMIAAGLGATAAYAKTTDGAQTLLAANASTEGDRTVLIIINVDEVFADGDGGQTVFIAGQTGTTNKFMANTVLNDAAAGTVLVLAGTLTEETALLVTGTPATGTGTGGISVTVLAFPAAT